MEVKSIDGISKISGSTVNKSDAKEFEHDNKYVGEKVDDKTLYYDPRAALGRSLVKQSNDLKTADFNEYRNMGLVKSNELLGNLNEMFEQHDLGEINIDKIREKPAVLIEKTPFVEQLYNDYARGQITTKEMLIALKEIFE